MFVSLLIALVGLSSSPAEAAVHVNVSGPGISVHVNPWSPSWSPAPRAGYRWAAGHYEGRQFVPGYWIPEYARAGYLWVPGYWDHYSYVEGYWRPAGRAGYTWVVASWYGGVYYQGGWVTHSAYRPGVPVYAYRSGVVRERAEDRNEHRYDYHEGHRDDDHQQANTSGDAHNSGSSTSRPPRDTSGETSSSSGSAEGSTGSTSRPPRDTSGETSSTSGRPPRDTSSSAEAARSTSSGSRQQADGRHRR